MDGRLFIVSGKKTMEAAELLEARVDASALAVAGERTGLWNVREFLQGADSLGPEDALVFFGAADAWEAETAGGEAVLDRFGMRCVVKGRRAMLTADEKPLEGRKERKAFLDHVRAACPEIGAEELAYFDSERRIALFDSLRAAINPFSMVLEQQAAPPPSSADLSALGRLQYRALALEFARDVLPGWLGF